jgi:XTP/dITP diphosphohydrolase
MKRRLVLASNNAKKLAELRALVEPLGVDLVAQGELGIPEAEEPHGTFLENALAKARHAAAVSGLPALADDSGLCVDALGGLPGVRSARFAQDAGRGQGDAANNAELLKRLMGVTDRRARFVCALVAVRSAQDPEPIVSQGRWALEVLDGARGEGGFGYDPIVRPVSDLRSVAQWTAAEKQAVSHRGQAMVGLLEQLRGLWGWV